MPGSQTCSPNSHRKPYRNVLRVFDVCSEKQCDSKSYFAFVVETFSELVVHTEIPRSRNSCLTTLSVTVSSRQSVQAPVVRKVVNAIHRINHYPVDSVVCFVNTYPLDSDLSGG